MAFLAGTAGGASGAAGAGAGSMISRVGTAVKTAGENELLNAKGPSQSSGDTSSLYGTMSMPTNATNDDAFEAPQRIPAGSLLYGRNK
jgi:hypothetical protein